MPALRKYKVFITHAWDYDKDYAGLVALLNKVPLFRWQNLSVPEHRAIPAEDTGELRYELRNQIRPSHIMLILAGMYVSHRDWLDWEMSFARRIGIPLVGVMPRGSRVVPSAVMRGADATVGWNSNSIVRAIREHALLA